MTDTANVIDMVVTRPAISDDYARLVEWVPDAAALYLFAGPSLVWPPTVAQFEELAARPGLSAWMVADDENDTARGHFDLTTQGRSARLGRVIVDPRYRGRGLGLALTRAAIEKARSLDVSEVRLAVVTDNEPAVRAYQRAGFTRVEDPERPQFTAMAYRLSDCPCGDRLSGAHDALEPRMTKPPDSSYKQREAGGLIVAVPVGFELIVVGLIQPSNAKNLRKLGSFE